MKMNALSLRKIAGVLALLVAAQGSAWAASSDKSYTGIVDYVDTTEHTVSLLGSIFNKQFNLSPNCVYLLRDHGNGKISDLRTGENITVQYKNVEGVLVVNHVTQNLMQFEGAVDNLNGKDHTVTVYYHHLDRTFNLAAQCPIRLENQKSGVFTNLQNGDHVLVTFETPGGTPTAQRIEQTSMVFTGKLKAVDLTEGTIKARAGFTLKKFSVAKNCAILIHGRAAQLSDFKPNDKLVLTYDTINGVNVVSEIVPEGEAKNVVEMDEFKIDL